MVRYRVLRSGRRVSGGTIMPEADCEPRRPDPARLIPYGFAVEWVSESGSGAPDDSGWQVIVVASDGPSALAGVEEGDWLIMVDRTTVGTEGDRRTLERAAEGSGPLLLSLRRDDRVKLVAISPAGCSAPGFLDSGLKVITSTRPRPARRNRVALGLDSDSRTSPASTVRCTSA